MKFNRPNNLRNGSKRVGETQKESKKRYTSGGNTLVVQSNPEIQRSEIYSFTCYDAAERGLDGHRLFRSASTEADGHRQLNGRTSDLPTYLPTDRPAGYRDRDRHRSRTLSVARRKERKYTEYP